MLALHLAYPHLSGGPHRCSRQDSDAMGELQRRSEHQSMLVGLELEHRFTARA